MRRQVRVDELMATVTSPFTADAWTPPFPVYRFTVEQYHRMIETGILTENDRVELLDGWIVPKMPHNPPHDGTIWIAQTALPEDVFTTVPAELWSSVLRRKGGSYALIARMPPDPSVN